MVPRDQSVYRTQEEGRPHFHELYLIESDQKCWEKGNRVYSGLVGIHSCFVNTIPSIFIHPPTAPGRTQERRRVRDSEFTSMCVNTGQPVMCPHQPIWELVLQEMSLCAFPLSASPPCLVPGKTLLIQGSNSPWRFLVGFHVRGTLETHVSPRSATLVGKHAKSPQLTSSEAQARTRNVPFHGTLIAIKNRVLSKKTDWQ